MLLFVIITLEREINTAVTLINNNLVQIIGRKTQVNWTDPELEYYTVYVHKLEWTVLIAKFIGAKAGEYLVAAAKSP